MSLDVWYANDIWLPLCFPAAAGPQGVSSLPWKRQEPAALIYQMMVCRALFRGCLVSDPLAAFRTLWLSATASLDGRISSTVFFWEPPIEGWELGFHQYAWQSRTDNVPTFAQTQKTVGCFARCAPFEKAGARTVSQPDAPWPVASDRWRSVLQRVCSKNLKAVAKLGLERASIGDIRINLAKFIRWSMTAYRWRKGHQSTWKHPFESPVLGPAFSWSLWDLTGSMRYVTQRDADGTWSVRARDTNKIAVRGSVKLAGLSEKLAALHARRLNMASRVIADSVSSYEAWVRVRLWAGLFCADAQLGSGTRVECQRSQKAQSLPIVRNPTVTTMPRPH